MRLVGVCLLGFGIVLLVPEAIFLANARSLPEVLAAVVCGAAIPLPMIIGGIALIRQEEDKGRRSPQPDTPHPPTPKYVNRANPVGDVLDRVRNFDLNRLNWTGWLLLLSTFGFVVGEA